MNMKALGKIKTSILSEYLFLTDSMFRRNKNRYPTAQIIAFTKLKKLIEELFISCPS